MKSMFTSNFTAPIFVIIFTIILAALSLQACQTISASPTLTALEGTEWVLTHMSNGQPVSENAEITLAFGSGRVTGKSACNRYSAGIEESKNVDGIRLGQSMSTKMACPDELMKIEQKYLDALSTVDGFSFISGSLALEGQKKDGNQYTLLFTQTETNTP